MDCTSPTVEQSTAALRLCAVEEPAVGYPCEQCYLYPYSKDGRMSTGRTCFEHLVMDTCQLIGHLNDFDQTQSKLALERCQRLEAQLAASQRRDRAAIEDIPHDCETCLLDNECYCLRDMQNGKCKYWQWRGPQEAGKESGG